MSMKYEDLQCLENEKKRPGIKNALTIRPYILPSFVTRGMSCPWLLPPQAFLQSLCSGPHLFLLSLALSLLLLVGICVIGTKNSEIQGDLDTLRATFNNRTSNTLAEVQTLHSQDGSLQEQITSLKAVVENHDQKLQAARSLEDKVISLETKLEKQQQELQGYPGVVLKVQQLAQSLKSLNCQIAALKSNDSQNACCPMNWLEHQGSCYWFSGTRLTWHEAEKYCQLENSHLVVINSREEQNFVQKHIGSSYTWMGLSDAEGDWKWADGTDYKTNFKNWAPGQPDDWQDHGLGGGEDCAHFRPDGSWNDDVCQRPYSWICETSLGRSL